MNMSMINKYRAGGFSLLEVLIAVVVLSVGLLALAVLQGALVRSAAEAKNRGAAVAFAEQVIENARTLTADDIADGALGSWANGACEGFEDTVDAAEMGENFDCNVNVTVLGFCLVAGTTTRELRQLNADEECPTGGVPLNRFAQATVRVSWADPSGEQRYASLSDAIGTMVPDDVIKVFQRPAATRRSPEVRILRPSETGIIPIALGNDRTAASSNPEPERTAQGRSTLTRFNVQTYVDSNSTINPLLQQRVDISVINCACSSVGALSTAGNPAFGPTYWNGDRYTVPSPVIGKPIGVRETRFAQQERFERQLCDSCCRDHHDKTGQVPGFDPYRPLADFTSGVHNHYHFDPNADAFTLRNVGEYEEVCRFVRTDGFNRVAVDTKLENLALLHMENEGGALIIPAATVNTYSEFVKAYVRALWQAYPGSFPSVHPNFADLLVSAPGAFASYESVLNLQNTVFPTPLSGADQRNMAARGIYVDYISSDAFSKLKCIGNTTDPACSYYKDKTVLEIIPFFAINLTKLAVWNSTDDFIIEVANDGISNTEYVRGLIEPGGDTGQARARIFAQRGNSGLVDGDPTDPDDQIPRVDGQPFAATGIPRNKFTVNLQTRVNDLAPGGVNMMTVLPSNPERRCVLESITQPGKKPPLLVRRCAYDKGPAPGVDMTELKVVVSNYNFLRCDNRDEFGECIGTPVVFDFRVCGIDFPQTNQWATTNQVVFNAGTADEYTVLTIKRATAGQTLSAPLNNVSLGLGFEQTAPSDRISGCPTSPGNPSYK